MKLVITLILLCMVPCYAQSADSIPTIYIGEQKYSPEAAQVKVAELLKGTVTQKSEAIDILLRYRENLDTTAFASQIRTIATQEAPYPELDKLYKAAKNLNANSHLPLSPEHKAETDRLGLQTLAICLLSINQPSSMDEHLKKLATSGMPSFELIAQSVPEILNDIIGPKPVADLSNKSPKKFWVSVEWVRSGAVPYTKEIGAKLFDRYQQGDLPFDQQILLLSILKTNQYEGIDQVIESLSKSENSDDRDLAKIITDLSKEK